MQPDVNENQPFNAAPAVVPAAGRFTEDQCRAFMAERDAGKSWSAIGLPHGISGALTYHYCQKFGFVQARKKKNKPVAKPNRMPNRVRPTIEPPKMDDPQPTRAQFQALTTENRKLRALVERMAVDYLLARVTL